MKPLLMAHGEKIFLAIVVGLGGWLLLAAATSLSSSTSLEIKDEANLEKVKKALDTNRPRQLPKLKYAGQLTETFGVGEPRTVISSSRLSNHKIDGVVIGEGSRTVQGEFHSPGGFGAKADRGKVVLKWLEPVSVHVKVEKFEIFRQEEETRQEEPYAVVEAGQRNYTFIDDKVKPETEYAYFIRTYGKASPPAGKNVDKPVGVTEKAGVWIVPEVGPAKAVTPSNIEFQCMSIYNEFGTVRARLAIKKWAIEDSKWLDFSTGPGIAEGEPVVGKRVSGFGKTETFDTGYTISQIIDSTKDEKFKVKTLNDKMEWIWVEKTRQVPDKRVILRKDTRQITIQVGRKRNTEITRVRTPGRRPPKPDEGSDLLRSLRDQINQRSGGAGPSQPGPSTKTTPTDQQMTDFKSSKGHGLKVPTSWAPVEEEGLMRMPYPRGLTSDLKDGFDKALAGSMPEILMVVHYHSMKHADYRTFMDGGETTGDAGLKRVGKDVLLPRMQKKITGSAPLGEAATVSTTSGTNLVVVAAEIKGKSASYTIVRYCVASLPNIDLITFVCPKADYKAQRVLMDKIAASLRM